MSDLPILRGSIVYAVETFDTENGLIEAGSEHCVEEVSAAGGFVKIVGHSAYLSKYRFKCTPPTQNLVVHDLPDDLLIQVDQIIETHPGLTRDAFVMRAVEAYIVDVLVADTLPPRVQAWAARYRT